MLALYSLALFLALLIGAPWWLFRMATSGKYREGLAERLGRVPERMLADDRPAIWVHAVSVGEVLAASRLIDELASRLPGWRVVSFHNNAHRTKDRTRAFRSGSRLLFPARLRLRRPRLAAGAAAAHGRAYRDRVLAAHARRMPPRENPSSRGERTHLRPLVAALSAPALSVEASAQQLLPSCWRRANSMPSA